ncbi:sulfatase [soil metagenome]
MRLTSTGRLRTGLVVAAALAIAVAVVASGTAKSGHVSAFVGQASKPKVPSRPNVVVIMSDDQTIEQQRVMQEINSRIGAKGAVFTNAINNFGLCCPSRATFLTGQYSQNDGVAGNNPPDGGYQGLDHSNTLPVWLQKRNYFTSNIGKYLNGYESTPQPATVPPGWSDWETSIKTYRYYDYTLNINRQIVPYAHAASDYKTRVYDRRAVKLIKERAGKRKPLFMWLNYLAPHDGGPDNDTNLPGGGNCQESAKPDPKDAGKFADEALPMPPSFNEADVSDKPEWIRDEQLSQTEIANVARQYRCRLESTLSEDRSAGHVLDALRDTHQLKNTYVIYISDNGFMTGEHRVPSGKNNIYEEAIHVPMMIRGPGIQAGTKVRDLVSNADVAPTITDLAGAKPGRSFDGRSVMPLIRHPNTERGRELVVQARYGVETPAKNVVAVRNNRFIYAEYENGDKEMYDLVADPDELDNIASDPAYADQRQALAGRLAKLLQCAGKSCRTTPHVRLTATGKRRHRCFKGTVRVGVRGGEAPKLTTVRFTLPGGQKRVDTEAPFEIDSPSSRFRRGASVRARADLIDGRQVELSKPIKGCS